MKKFLLLAFLAVAVVAAGGAALFSWPLGGVSSLKATKGDAKHGAYLARMAGCIACHTNAKQGGPPLAGGLALKTDFGTFYTPNLTTDQKQGIGAWSVEDFAKAVRKGVSPDGAPYYPAFPYPFYAKFSDQDIADLWAAFQTVPANDLPSKDHELKIPFNFRSGLKLWRAAYLDFGSFSLDPEKSDQWNRGKYIVRGAAHCGACHTPRNFAGARQAEFALHGSDGLPDGGKSPPITAQALNEGGWTVNNLAYALRTGVMPDGDAFGGSMGEVVRDGTQYLSQQDREAIATFLLNKD